MDWQTIGILVSVLSPLVGVPLIMITLYLRTIREHQTSTLAELTHRIQTIEASIHDLIKATAGFEREYTTKEEWLREAMFARQRLESLNETMAKIHCELENGHGVASEIARVSRAMWELAQRLPQPTGTGTKHRHQASSVKDSAPTDH